MKKWLRWQGLIVFGVVSCIILIFWIFLVDTIVKRTIEKAGTKVVGAKVELADADVRLFPPGLTLTNLQVTNPDSPMFNAVEAGRIDFSPDVLNLLKRKIIIDTMAIEGVRFNTSRKTSGAVVSQKQEKAPSGTQPDSPSAAQGCLRFRSRTSRTFWLEKNSNHWIWLKICRKKSMLQRLLGKIAWQMRRTKKHSSSIKRVPRSSKKMPRAYQAL